MPQLDKKKDKPLIFSLIDENFTIASRHLRKYAEAAIYMDVPFGEVKTRMEEMIEKILKESENNA